MQQLTIVQIESFSGDFLQRHHAAHPGLADAPFAAWMRSLLDSGYSGGHNVVPYLNPSRWRTHYLVPNAAAAQRRWLADSGETATDVTPAEILARQIEALAPDVVYLSDIPVFDFALLDRLPKRPVVVGWHATYLDPRMAWPQIDLLLSGIGRLRERALALGVRAAAHHMPAAPAYRNAGGSAAPVADFVFSGSFYGGIHQARAQQYRTVSRHIGQRWLDIHTPAGFPTEPGERIAFHPPVYGSDVLTLYARSRVVLDARGEFNLGDHAEVRETSNMRVFEATRAGALLLTEAAANLGACFEIGREIETFGSTAELVDKARHYADPANEPARARIAAAGHARVMREHLIEHRAVAFERLLDTHLGLHAKPRVPAVAGRHVVATTVEAGSVLFGLAAVENLRRLLPDALLHVQCRDAASRALLRDAGVTLIDGDADMPALARRLQQLHPGCARVTCVDASIALRDAAFLGREPDAVHLLELGWSDADAHAAEALGRHSHALLSLPGGCTLDLGGSADALAAAAGGALRPVPAAAPWNAADADASAFVFFLLRLKNASTWEFMTLGSAEAWAACYQRHYLPYLQRVADVLRRHPQITGDQQTPLSASALAAHLFRRDQLAKSGYRLLTAQQYAAFRSDPQGWDSIDVARTQHGAFQHLIGEYQAGRQRQDLRALATLMRRIAEPGMRVLETGCGSGYNHQFLQAALPEAPLHYTGIDLAPAMVAMARDVYRDARYDVMGSEALSYADGAFDIVLNGASLMHTVDYERAIAEARRVARRYVVLHTVTVHDGDEHLYFEKNAYGGTVVEVCFSSTRLNALLAAHRLMPVLMEDSIGYDLRPVLGVATRSVSIACLCLDEEAAGADGAAANHYCTYFDVNYLPRGVLMMQSVLRHDPGARFFVLCLDDASHAAVAQHVPAATPVHVDALMAADPEFAACRGNRSQIEWYFTATSCFVHHLMQQHPELPRITYLDADLYFHAPPAWMHDEARGAAAQIVGHRFAPGSERLEIYGKYNVGWIGFAFDSDEGRRLVADYRADCIDWCYDRVEPGRFGDQKYLDRWPERYPSTCVSRILGANVGPWNLARWTRLRPLGDDWYIEGERLVFFHFSGLRRNAPGDYATKEAPAAYGVYHDALYAPYLKALGAMETALGSADASRDIRYGSW